MDEFLQLKWGITEPHELDTGPHFIPENEICLSYIYSGIKKEEITPEGDTAKDNVAVKRQLVPGQLYNYKCNIKSFLDTIEQTKCLIALKLHQAGKKPTGIYERNCVELYNNSHQQILIENAKFLEFAQDRFKQGNKKMFKLKQLLKNYSVTLWKWKMSRCKDYTPFYKGFDMLPYSYKDDEEPIEMLHVQNLLELGSLARFSAPTLLKSYFLKNGDLPKAKVLYNSNQTVSKDQNIDRLIETTNTDVVISSSGLMKLLNFTKTNTAWDIPIIVKEKQIRNRDGSTKTKNVVFIDKPLPSKSPTVFELNDKCFKTLLKTNFCDARAFSFENSEVPIDVHQLYQHAKATNTAVEPTKSPLNGKEIMNIDARELLDKVDSQETNEKIKLDLENETNKIHHNVSYRLWKLQLKNDQCELMKSKYNIHSIHVLVRTKLDGCESLENGQLQPINISSKVEYHLQYGAGIPSRDELLKEWVQSSFRPCSLVHRIRTHFNTGEVICVENCNAQKITHEAQTHHQLSLHLGLGVLYKICSRLVQLLPGNYLLHHLPKDGAFVSLLQETTEADDGVYKLHDEYDINKCGIHSNKWISWHPIDVNFILPKHDLAHQMPGMFQPKAVVRKFPGKVWKRTNRKKKKKKAKPKNMAATTTIEK